MLKIISYLTIIIFIIGGCSKKTYNTLPDNTLNETDNKTIKKTTLLTENERKKIASIVEVAPKKIVNDELYALINKWLNVPYLYGGEDKNGIDCSAITKKVFNEIYNIELPRTSDEMFWSKIVNRFKKKRFLKEGDLVFFRIDKDKTISHVGIYLQNNKFFSSNVSGGVQIADLNSPYWTERYVASGRIKAKQNSTD
jgi:lipoprotein Spr